MMARKSPGQREVCGSYAPAPLRTHSPRSTAPTPAPELPVLVRKAHCATS